MTQRGMRFSFGLMFCVLFLSLNLSSVPVWSDEAQQLIVSDFSEQQFGSWEEKLFSDHTHYQWIDIEGVQALRAQADSSASALYRKITVDLDKTPYLNWSWRVENTLPIDQPELKQNDDYPARIYVVIREGFFPWQTKALNYVWCNRQTDKAFWPNPFTDAAIMIPVRCGDEGVGQWQSERVNIAEDFFRIFGYHISEINGVAIMTDTDNSQGSATAYYGEIRFSN